MKRYIKHFFVISAFPVFLLAAIFLQTNTPVFAYGKSQEGTGAILEAEEGASGTIDVIVKEADTGNLIEAGVTLVNIDTGQSYGSYYNPGSNPWTSPTDARFFNLDTDASYKVFVTAPYAYPNDTPYLDQYYNNHHVPEDLKDSSDFTVITFDGASNVIEIEVVLSPSAIIQGRFVDAETLEPLGSYTWGIDRIELSQTLFGNDHYVDTAHAHDNPFIVNRNIYDSEVKIEVLTHAHFAPTTVTVNPTLGTTTTVDIPLEKAGIITGRVTRAADGTSIPSMYLHVYDANEPEANKVLGSTQTNNDGEFRLNAGLAPGSYILRTEQFNCPYNQGSLREAECFDGVFYGGNADINSATPIQVSNGVTTTDINFQLTPLPTISGNVTFSDGPPENNLWRYVEIYTDTVGYPLREVNIGSSQDDFVFSVAPGTYYLKAKPSYNSEYVSEFYNDKTRASAEPIVVQPGTDVSNINFQLDRGAIISGTIVNERTKEPIPNANVSVLVVVDEDPNSNDSFITSATTDLNGEFQISRLQTGSAYINVSVYGSFEEYRSFQSYETMILEDAESIQLNKGNTHFLEIELKPFAKVSGTVVDSVNGLPVVNASININNGYSNETSQLDGSFEIQFDVNQLNSTMTNLNIVGPCVQESYNNSICQYVTIVHPLDLQNGEEINNLNFVMDYKAILTGKMIDESTSEPLNARVHAQLLSEAPDPYSQDWYNCYDYDPDHVCGNEYILYLDPGDYVVGIHEDGYLSEYYDNASFESDASIVSLAANETRVIDFDLYKGDNISGKVTDAVTGESLTNITVVLYQQNERGGYYTNKWVDTDNSGEYEFTGLPAGEYHIFFNSRTKYIDRFYGGSLTLDDAEAITLAKGSNIEIDMALDEGATLNVQLIDPKTHERAYYPFVGIYREDGSRYPSLKRVDPDETGGVTYQGLAAGPHYLLLGAHTYGDYYVTEFYTGTNTLKNAVPIMINDQEDHFETITLRLMEAISVTLTTDQLTTPLAENTPVDVNIYQIDDQCNCEKLYKAETITLDKNSSSKSFYIFGLNPSYDYVAVANESMTAPFSQHRSETISFENGIQPQVSINLQSGNTISGKVTASDTGDSLKLVQVLFYEKISTDGEEEYIQVGSDYTNSTGQYRSPGLPDGTYYVSFDTTEAENIDHPYPAGTEKIEAQYYVSKVYGSGYQIGGIDKVNPTPIVLNSSNQTLDIQLDRGGTIEGKINFSSLYRSSYFVAKAYLKTADGLIYAGRSRQKENYSYSYTIPGLPAGEYQIVFEDTEKYHSETQTSPLRRIWYGGFQNPEDGLTVSLTEGDIIENINPTNVIAGGKILINIDIEQRPIINELDELANDKPTVSLYDADGKLVDQTTGTYTAFAGLWPGEYFVHFEDWSESVSGYCNSAIHYGEWHNGADSIDSATPITILGTESHTVYGALSINGEPSLPPNEYLLSGRIVDQSGDPIAGVSVTASTGRQAAGSSTVTDSNGEYFLALPNGSYNLTFEKSGYDFTDANVQVTIEGINQTAEEIVAPPETEATPTPDPEGTPTPNPTETPEPPSSPDNTIFLPVVTR